MKYLRNWLGSLAFLVTLLATAGKCVAGDRCPSVPLSASGRYIVVISDLHFGQGEANKKEDFLWGKELDAFLLRISECGQGMVDLVIAGDLLDLWQPPADIKCEGPDPDHGCSVDEAAHITHRICDVHKAELTALNRFSLQGENRLFLVPGNHDAALFQEAPWRIVANAIGGDPSRVKIVENGIWLSADGSIVVEHGNQIWRDENKYEKWPLVADNVHGVDYLVRSWGERFVQKQFNADEETYPIIDNLSPVSAGLRYRMQDRGLWRSIADVVRFLRFNVMETSLSQKVAYMGPEDIGGMPQVWNLDYARTLGHKLLAGTLPEDDPFRRELLGPSEEAVRLRRYLDNLFGDKGDSGLSDLEIGTMCNEMAVRSSGVYVCVRPHMGGLVQKAIRTHDDIILSHLSVRLGLELTSGMRVFIYGHSHDAQDGWTLKAGEEGRRREIKVLNSGAFQRVVNEKGFLRLAGGDPAAGLRTLQVKDLPPCYTAVIVDAIRGRDGAKTVIWHMPDGDPGEFVDFEKTNSVCN